MENEGRKEGWMKDEGGRKKGKNDGILREKGRRNE